MKNWLAPAGIKLPDFIICGAMKSSTTTLHAMLNQHPDIFIPEKEVHFFDYDNILQHPDFNTYENKNWFSLNIKDNKINGNEKRVWQWYAQQFSVAHNNQIIGEDSTTYLASPLAAKRIALQTKPIKLIIMLRQPTLRAYSQYWHLVRSGRVGYDFETLLQLSPHTILNRSLYLQQIKSVLEFIPQAQVKFIIFEEFLKNKESVLKGVCNFIHVDYNSLPAQALKLHENASSYPKYYRLQLLKNRLFPLGGNLNYINNSGENNYKNATQKQYLRYLNAIHRKINPLISKKPKQLSNNTKVFLDNYFKSEIEGINELIGRDVISLWFDE